MLKISGRTTVDDEALRTLRAQATAGAPVQRWIRIQRLETTEFPLIRLVISVNGVNYSYPSQAVWAQVGDNREKFPLPHSDEQYRIAFRAFLSKPGDPATVEAGAQAVDEVALEQLPVRSKTCTLFALGGGSGVYGTREQAVRVEYAVE